MTKKEFIQQAKAAGKSKEETYSKFKELDAAGRFDDSVSSAMTEPLQSPPEADVTSVRVDTRPPLKDTGEGDITAGRFLFPRFTKQRATGEGMADVSLGLDVLSSPFRALASSVGTVAEQAGSIAGGKPISKEDSNKAFLKKMAQIGASPNQKGVERYAEEIVRDPANIATIIPPLAVASKAPALTNVLARIAEPALSIAIHQGENLAEGKDVSGAEVGTEAALSALPYIVSGSSQLTKKMPEMLAKRLGAEELIPLLNKIKLFRNVTRLPRLAGSLATKPIEAASDVLTQSAPIRQATRTAGQITVQDLMNILQGEQ
jgi:hypothetical protein